MGGAGGYAMPHIWPIIMQMIQSFAKQPGAQGGAPAGAADPEPIDVNYEAARQESPA
jgi:hypothetical protein